MEPGRLILALAEIDGLDRIRHTTSHPLDMNDELIAAHGNVPQLMPVCICHSVRFKLYFARNEPVAIQDAYIGGIDKLRWFALI